MAQALAATRVSARLQAKEEAKDMHKTNSSSSSEGRAAINAADIQLVQELIQRCMQNYMAQKDVVQTLQQQAKIEPGFTTLVWSKLEEQNPEFFKAYYLRLKLKDQIVMFNYLVEQQMAAMHKLHASWLQAMPQMMARPPGMMGGGMVPGYGGMVPGGAVAGGAPGVGGMMQAGGVMGGPGVLPLSPLDPSSLIGTKLDVGAKGSGSSGTNRPQQTVKVGGVGDVGEEEGVQDTGIQGSEEGAEGCPVPLDPLSGTQPDLLAHLGELMQGSADDLIEHGGGHADLMPKNFSFSDFAAWPELHLPAVNLGEPESGAAGEEGASASDLARQGNSTQGGGGSSGAEGGGSGGGKMGGVRVASLGDLQTHHHDHSVVDEVMGGAIAGLGVGDDDTPGHHHHHSFDEGLDGASPFGLMPDIGPLNFDDDLHGHTL